MSTNAFPSFCYDLRINQNYEVLYSTVDDPGTFISIEDVNFDPGNFNSAKASITDDTLVPLATNAGALQFAFGSQQNGHVGYRELDAIGVASQVASVPEPASIAIWSILGLCLAGYGYRRRRTS